MRSVPRALLAGLLGVAVSLLAACGSSGSLLSADQGSTLNAQLKSVASAYAAHNCPAAVTAAGAFQNSASSLSGVDPALSNAVAQGAAGLLADVQSRCPTQTSAPAKTTTTNTSTTTSTPSTTTTSAPPTTSTPTTSTPTVTTTSPAPTTTTPPPATTPTGSGTTSTGNGGAGIGGGGGY